MNYENHRRIRNEIVITCQGLPPNFAFSVACAIIISTSLCKTEDKSWIPPKIKNRNGSPLTIRPTLPTLDDYYFWYSNLNTDY